MKWLTRNKTAPHNDTNSYVEIKDFDVKLTGCSVVSTMGS